MQCLHQSVKLLLSLLVIQIVTVSPNQLPTAHLLMKIVFVIIMKSSIYHILKIYNDIAVILGSSTVSKLILIRVIRVINIKTAQKLNLKPGQKLCRHCYEHVANNDNLNTEDMLEDLDASFYDYTLEMKESSFDAEAIGVSESIFQ